MDYVSDFTENTTFIPINGGHKSAYIVNVAASQGQKILINAQFEITSELPFAVGIGRYIKRSDGARINPATMDNVILSTHHKVANISVIDPSPIPNANYELMIYAASSGARNGDVIRLEQGYGFLQALVLE